MAKKHTRYEVIWKDEGEYGPVWVAPAGTFNAGKLSAEHRALQGEWTSRTEARLAAERCGADFITT